MKNFCPVQVPNAPPAAFDWLAQLPRPDRAYVGCNEPGMSWKKVILIFAQDYGDPVIGKMGDDLPEISANPPKLLPAKNVTVVDYPHEDPVWSTQHFEAIRSGNHECRINFHPYFQLQFSTKDWLLVATRLSAPRSQTAA
jgi:hypothetical protein